MRRCPSEQPGAQLEQDGATGRRSQPPLGQQGVGPEDRERERRFPGLLQGPTGEDWQIGGGAGSVLQYEQGQHVAWVQLGTDPCFLEYNPAEERTCCNCAQPAA